MARLEDLPYELLFMIVDHLDHYGRVVLHSLSKKFSFIHPRIGTRAYFDGSTGDERVLKKLQDIHNSVDGTGGIYPKGKPPVEFVFDLTGLPLTGPHWEIISDVVTIMELIACKSPLQKVRIVGSWEQARELLEMFRKVKEEEHGIQNCSLIIAPGNEGYKRNGSKMTYLWAVYRNMRILHIAGITGIKKISLNPCAGSRFDSRLFDPLAFGSHRLRELYIGCDHGKKNASNMHECITKKAELGREVELPYMLWKLVVSCRRWVGREVARRRLARWRGFCYQ